MEYVNANNPGALLTFVEDAPPLILVEQIAQAPPIEASALRDIIIATMPPALSAMPSPSPQAPPRSVQRLPTTRQQRTRLKQLLADEPTISTKELSQRCRMGYGSTAYWRKLHNAETDIIEGRRKNCGPKFKGVQYIDIILQTLKVEHKTIRVAANKCSEHHANTQDATPPPSPSSIQRFIHSDSFIELAGEALSWKVMSIRGINSNSETNKTLRIDRVRELQHRLRDGYLWIAVDETHLELSSCHARRAWGPKNQRTFLYGMKKGLKISLLTAISTTKVEHCLAISGKVNQEVFLAYTQRLLATIPVNDKVVLWMDNASVHNDVETQLQSTRHTILKNAPYSPALNPIEIFFGAFKQRLEALRRIPNNMEELLLMIAETIRETPQDQIRREFENVRTVVWQKVAQREDI